MHTDHGDLTQGGHIILWHIIEVVYRVWLEY